jgi:hypothetical protein
LFRETDLLALGLMEVAAVLVAVVLRMGVLVVQGETGTSPVGDGPCTESNILISALLVLKEMFCTSAQFLILAPTGRS